MMSEPNGLITDLAKKIGARSAVQIIKAKGIHRNDDGRGAPLGTPIAPCNNKKNDKD